MPPCFGAAVRGFAPNLSKTAGVRFGALKLVARTDGDQSFVDLGRAGLWTSWTGEQALQECARSLQPLASLLEAAGNRSGDDQWTDLKRLNWSTFFTRRSRRPGWLLSPSKAD